MKNKFKEDEGQDVRVECANIVCVYVCRDGETEEMGHGETTFRKGY